MCVSLDVPTAGGFAWESVAGICIGTVRTCTYVCVYQVCVKPIISCLKGTVS